MASGVKLDDYPTHIVEALVGAQLDSDLADYYKLVATINAQIKDVKKAQEFLDKYVEVALPEMHSYKPEVSDVIKSELAQMDSWLLKVDKRSLPKRTDILIPRDVQLDFKPKKRKR